MNDDGDPECNSEDTEQRTPARHSGAPCEPRLTFLAAFGLGGDVGVPKLPFG